MRLLFKQRMFSWFDSYDVYNEAGETVYKVKGELAWGHMFRIYNALGVEVGCIKQKVFSLLPRFEMYAGERCIGSVTQVFTLFWPRFRIDYSGWQADGDWMGWDYTIRDGIGETVATVSKELWNWTDTYSIDLCREQDALYALMLVLAIDAGKDSLR